MAFIRNRITRSLSTLSTSIRASKGNIVVGRLTAGGGLTEEIELSGDFQLDDDGKLSVPELTGKMNVNPAITVANAAARKNPASYEAAELQIGALKVKQTDLEGVLWLLIADDVTDDNSWMPVPDAFSTGIRVYNPTTDSYYILTLTGTPTNEYLTWTPEV